jgi:hypothetical protein
MAVVGFHVACCHSTLQWFGLLSCHYKTSSSASEFETTREIECSKFTPALLFTTNKRDHHLRTRLPSHHVRCLTSTIASIFSPQLHHHSRLVLSLTFSFNSRTRLPRERRFDITSFYPSLLLLKPRIAMSDNPPPATYPPGAVPTPHPVMAPPVPPSGPSSQSALAPGASFNNLLQALIPRGPPLIQRPIFAAPSRQAPLPAGYPAPILVDPALVHIKHMTDTFHAAATNDPTFYKLYCSVRDAQSHYTAYPDLVFFLRLHLQVSWIDLLERHHRQSEVEGNTIRLISERKELIGWLVKRDQTLKSRAGQYLAGQLARFAPLEFDPSQVSPLIALLDHLYVLENKLFFEPKEPRALTRQEYRIKVVTLLDFEGGKAKIVEDVNISKRIGCFELMRTLSTLTQNIQATQLAYTYGFQSGGHHGHWVYWANETGTSKGWAHVLSSEVQLMEMKALLEQGQKIYIMHVSYPQLTDYSLPRHTPFTIFSPIHHILLTYPSRFLHSCP